MPYYRWRGVALTGTIKKGTLFARSFEHLDLLLLKRDIALLSCSPIRYWLTRSITIADQVNVFSQLSTLIDAGVLVPEALDLVANQVGNPQLQEIMHDIAKKVAEGVSLSYALSLYPELANQVVVQLIKAGEESGQLASMLDALCRHFTTIQDFYQKLRSALLLPTMTLLFFLMVFLIIFVFVMPRFIDLFLSMGKEIPPMTRWLLAISTFMQGAGMGFSLLVFVIIVFTIWRYTRKGIGRILWDSILAKAPFVGPLFQERFLAYSMQALSVLLAGGMPLLEALNVVQSSIQNHIFKQQLTSLAGDVAAGSSLSDAMIQQKEAIFGQDITAMVEVAEASAKLPLLLNRISFVYYNRVAQKLALITLFLQPVIMVILGLLVAMLIFAVYGPILTLSSAV